MPEDVQLVMLDPVTIEQQQFQSSQYTAWSRKELPTGTGWIITFAAYLSATEDTGIDDVRATVQKLMTFKQAIDEQSLAYLKSKLEAVEDPTGAVKSVSDLIQELMQKLTTVISVEKTATQPAPQTDWSSNGNKVMLATHCQVVPEAIPQPMPEIQ